MIKVWTYASPLLTPVCFIGNSHISLVNTLIVVGFPGLTDPVHLPIIILGKFSGFRGLPDLKQTSRTAGILSIQRQNDWKLMEKNTSSLKSE